MRHYEKYKSSGIEWIGTIPEHWSVKRLKFNTYIKARVGWHGLRADEFSLSDGVLCVTGTDFQNGVVNWESCYRVSQERYQEDPYIQLRENDLLITKDGTIGKIAIVKKLAERATLNSGIFVVRPVTNEYITSFMYWALQSPIFFEYVNYTSKGSTINHLYQETFLNLPFVLPAPKEQIAIANYLDAKTNEIDTFIEKKQKLIQLLREERGAIINLAVTKGTNRNVKLKTCGIESLGNIPQHWEVKKLKFIATIISGAAFDSTSFSKSGSVKVLKIANIQHDYIDWTDTEYLPDNFATDYARFRLLSGDIVFALTRPIISTGIKSARIVLNENEIVLLNQRNAILRVTKYLYGPFIYFVTHSNYFYHMFEASIDDTGQQPNISPISIMNFEINLPPYEEQIAISEHIEAEAKRINGAITKIEKEIDFLKAYRKALISEVVTGKIRVV